MAPSPEQTIQSGLFKSTQWTIVNNAAGDNDAALQALSWLCEQYWRPLYIFVRQRGMDHDDAADAVQGFFAFVCSRDVFARVERRETRFRTFLLAVFKNWLADQRDRAHALKRGGGLVRVDLSDSSAMPAPPELMEGETPEHCFDRTWARAVFDSAIARLDEELGEGDRVDYMLEIRRRLLEGGQPDWSSVATRFGTTMNAVKQMAFSIRGRFAVLLKKEVRALVSSDSDVDDELRYLVRQLSS